MLFNSATFLFLFLPATIVIFFLLLRTERRGLVLAWLLLASVAFYLSWQPWMIVVPAGSIAANFLLARLLSRPSVLRPQRLALLWGGIVLNISLLVYYKAVLSPWFFSADARSAAFLTSADILIPLGISFITFQQIAFLVDCYRGKIERPRLIEYCLFILFFPQLVIGPIVHYRELVPQFRSAEFMRLNWDNITFGGVILIIGLFKKVVIADSIAPYADEVFASVARGESISLLDAWFGAVAFQFQLYFDFSGYADMAIGLARLCNIHLPINFDSPLKARNRFDLWQRWHISFTVFMRQYVFMPLVRNRWAPVPVSLAIVCTGLLSGLWHGFGSTFLLWGGLQGLLLLGIHYRNHLLPTSRYTGFVPTRSMQIMSTFFITLLLSILFRSADLASAWRFIATLFNGDLLLAAGSPVVDRVLAIASHLGLNASGLKRGATLIEWQQLLMLLAAGCVAWGLPNTRQLLGTHWRALDQRLQPPPEHVGWLPTVRLQLNLRWAWLLGAMLVASLLLLERSTRFVYFQF